jgi:arginase
MERFVYHQNRSDIGAGTRSDLGVDAIEIAAINKNSDYFNRFEFEDVKRTTKASMIK